MNQSCVAADTPSTRLIVLTLRTLGVIDMLAFAAVIMPEPWMAGIHAWAGLGTMPDSPIVGYLARSASALYALHGMLVVYMSRDVRRYWDLIRFFAAVAVAHGLVMLAIDLGEGMPGWWIAAEGPTFALTGVLVLAAQSRTRLPTTDAPADPA